nr:MAG: capsid protein [Cressdnaviricota sp.]
MRKYVRSRSRKRRSSVYRKRSVYRRPTKKSFKGRARKFVKRSNMHMKCKTRGRMTNFSQGRRQHISPSFVNKVRAAGSNTNVYLNTVPGYMSTLNGTCSYSVPLIIPTPSDINTMYNAIASTAGVSTVTKWTIDRAVSEIDVTNVTDADVNFRVYECIPRSDIPQLSASSITSISDLINVGFVNAGNLALALNPSATLYQSTDFCSWCKIDKVLKYVMKPGESRTFSVASNKPYSMNYSHVFPTGYGHPTWLLVPRQARFLVFQMWGPVSDDSTVSTNVSYAAAKLSFIVRDKFNYSWTEDLLPTVSITSTLPSGGSFVGKVINEASGGGNTVQSV